MRGGGRWHKKEMQWMKRREVGGKGEVDGAEKGGEQWKGVSKGMGSVQGGDQRGGTSTAEEEGSNH